MFKQSPAKYNKATEIIGASHDIAGNLALYAGFMTTVNSLIILYTVSIAPSNRLPWLSLWLFIALVFTAGILAAVIVRKLVIPVRMAYYNHQSHKHENPVLKEINERFDRLEAKIDKQGNATGREKP